MSKVVSWSKTVTFFEDDWHDGNVPIMGVRTHAAWLCTSVFDGARAFQGVTPDLDLHCARVNESAKAMCLKPFVPKDTWVALVREGLKRFDRDAELYIRPMYWAEDAAGGAVRPDPETTRWCLTLYVAPLPKPTGTAITLSPFRRPTRESALVEAKAGCLYPNNARAMIEARSRGFDNCITCDALGNVAELASANIFMAKDGVVFTPVANGTFLSGITRARVIALLRHSGVRSWRRRCAMRILPAPMRSSPPAITAKSRRSSGLTTVPCSRVRSIGVPVSFTGNLRTPMRPEPAVRSRPS